MSRRAHVWFLVAIILLAVATTVALTRQQANFDQHEKLDRKACSLALTNRELLLDNITIHRQEHATQGDPVTEAKLVALEHRLQRVIAETKVNCAE